MPPPKGLWFSNGLSAKTAAGYSKEQYVIDEICSLMQEQNGHHGGLELGLRSLSRRQYATIRITQHERATLLMHANLGDDYSMLHNKAVMVYTEKSEDRIEREGRLGKDIVGISYSAR